MNERGRKENERGEGTGGAEEKMRRKRDTEKDDAKEKGNETEKEKGRRKEYG